MKHNTFKSSLALMLLTSISMLTHASESSLRSETTIAQLGVINMTGDPIYISYDKCQTSFRTLLSWTGYVPLNRTFDIHQGSLDLINVRGELSLCQELGVPKHSYSTFEYNSLSLWSNSKNTSLSTVQAMLHDDTTGYNINIDFLHTNFVSKTGSEVEVMLHIESRN